MNMGRKTHTCAFLILSQISFFIIFVVLYRKNYFFYEIIFQSEMEGSVALAGVQEVGEITIGHKEESKLANLKAAMTTATSSVAKRSGHKPRFKLIIAVVSAPTRADRRTGLRKTWMSECSRPDVVCRFFTDALKYLEPELQKALMAENLQYNDMEFMPIPPGYNFGARILWLLQWTVRNYEFDFFLRTDDDYFVCLRRLLDELPQRVSIPRLYWGYFHCSQEGQVRVDEGFLMLSTDLIREFVRKRDQLLCHPFGDQTVALWLNNRTDITRFHDPRIIYHVTAYSTQYKALDICGTYLALHGSYLHQSVTYWEIVKKNGNQKYWVPSIQPFEQVCKLETYFDWNKMIGRLYKREPKPCAANPEWPELKDHKMHIGRANMK